MGEAREVWRCVVLFLLLVCILPLLDHVTAMLHRLLAEAMLGAAWLRGSQTYVVRRKWLLASVSEGGRMSVFIHTV